MSYSKFRYYRVIASLVGIIIFLIMCIAIIPPQVEIKEVEVVKKVVVEVAKDPTYIYNITSTEREMLARLVYREANTESLECQMAIVSVVINRWQHGMWGDTLKDVIYYPYQFTPANLIYKTTPTEANYTAVDLVLQNGCTIPSYVLYFRANYGFSGIWDGYVEYRQIDNTCFGYFVADKNNQHTMD